MSRWATGFELSDGSTARYVIQSALDDDWYAKMWCPECNQIRPAYSMVWVDDVRLTCSTCIGPTEYCCNLCPSQCSRDIARESLTVT